MGRNFLILLNIFLLLTFSPKINAQTQGQDLGEEEYTRKRLRMVKLQIEARGIKDEKTLEAMRKVPRHKFVLPRYLPMAYADQPLPIGEGQTISQPYIVALMTEKLALKPTDKVLEVGTGSGYQAAVLSQICDKVYTIEIIKTLGEKAKARLQKLGYTNITVEIGDGYYGWEEHAPFDAIIVTAAAGHIPPPLIQQLKPGGRMVIPIGAVFQIQRLMFVKKNLDGTLISENICPVRFVPLLGGH